jgi:hypothetical protein
MKNPEIATGGCLCGGVRYRIDFATDHDWKRAVCSSNYRDFLFETEDVFNSPTHANVPNAANFAGA